MNSKKTKINYFFFSLWFLLLSSFTLSHLQNLESDKVLFTINSFIHCFLEISIGFLVISYSRKIFPEKITKVLVGLSFIFLMGRFINFVMIKLMDTTISYAYNMLLGNGIKNLITNLEAADINTPMLFGLSACLIITPIIGYYIYFLCDKLSSAKPIYVTHRFSAKFFIIFLILSLSFDIATPYLLNNKNLDTFKKRLPYSLSLFSNKKNEITFDEISFSVKDEDEIDKNISQKNSMVSSEQNVFLFVIESLRKDYITPSTSPCLASFRDENIHFKNSFSTANGTHLSWFSIFYCTYPFNWTGYKESWQNGSTSLKLFKSLDYKINVLSSANLKYHGMDELIFGKNHSLTDSFISYSDKQAWLRDKKAFSDLKNKTSSIKDNKNLFVVFLDSTHSEYNWPDDFKPKFLPVNKSVNYLKFAYSQSDLALLKNRYKNAVNYLDTLFEDFFDHLKKNGLYENSIIVVTADHGEEFFEGGSLFHGTHLNKYQTSIPTFYKLPKKTMENISDKDKVTSLIDIFPSIFHALTLNESYQDIFSGHSVLSQGKKPFCICSTQNGANNSTQFAVLNKDKITILNHLKENKFEVVKTDDLEENELTSISPGSNTAENQSESIFNY